MPLPKSHPDQHQYIEIQLLGIVRLFHFIHSCLSVLHRCLTLRTKTKTYLRLASKMEFEQGYHNGPNSSLGYPFQPYHHNGRNVGLAIANGARSNPRVCPVAIPMGGTRMRFAGGREEEHEPSRRSRVAVAVSFHCSPTTDFND